MKDFIKFAVIDHVGKVTNPDGSDLTKSQFSELYNKMFGIAEADGYTKNKTVVTMKKFCEMNFNPKSTKPFDKALPKMKFAMRHQKTVSQVYFICPALYKNVEQEVKKWAERGVPVKVYAVKDDELFDYDRIFLTTSNTRDNEDFYATHKFDFTGRYSRKARILDKWALAIGAPLEAPCTRVQMELYGENYIKRPDHDSLVASGETHITKPFTSSYGFLTHNRCIETNKNINNWFNQLLAYAEYAGGKIITEDGPQFGAFVGDKASMNEFLEPDWIVCENCGLPMKMHASGGTTCEHCGKSFDEDVAFSIYYEDAYFDDEVYDDILDDDIEDELTEEAYFEQLEAEEQGA